MRVHRKVLSRDTGVWLLCCWDTCERPGYDLYSAVVNDGFEPVYNTEFGMQYLPKTIKYVFCSERHKMYWVDAAGPGGLQGKLRQGNRSLLPPG
jgi:hypothetical protein